MSRKRTLTLAVIVALVGMAAVPMAASAATDLSVEIDQRPETGEAIVTVTENGSAVENATVNVTAESTYQGIGEYETDANGTVTLPNPNETVSVTVSVTKNNTTTSSEIELAPLEDSLDASVAQGDNGNATVTVTQYGDPIENATVNVSADTAYDGTGTYETDENGTVTLPNPNETVDVGINASANGVTASTTATLVPYEESVDLTVAQADDGTVTITVEQYGEPVENASVVVDGEKNYTDEGEYTTDENGTVTLAQPEFDQNITVTATVADLTVETTTEINGYATLEVTAEQRSDGVFVTVTYGSKAVEDATVDVEADGDYSGTGTWETDENGHVVLPLPEENVTITVTASAKNETARTRTELTVEFVEEQGPFGQAVSMFVSVLQNAVFEGPPGQIIADFVTGNNPGNADGAAENANNGATADEENETDDAPGQSGAAPGQSDETPGQSDGANGAATAQGGAEDEPGRSGEAGGASTASSGDASGRSDEAGDGSDDAPGQSGDAPGRSDDDDGNETDTQGNGNSSAPADDNRGTPDDASENGGSDDGDAEDGDSDSDRGNDADSEGDSDTAGDSSGNGGDSGSSGNSGGGPGNSENAPGRN